MLRRGGMATAEELDRAAHDIVESSFAVHRTFGPGCYEEMYVHCLSFELRKRGLTFRHKVPLSLQYEDLVVPRAYEADFIVAPGVLIEVKAVERTAGVHMRQVSTYLRITGLPLGLLVNFGAETLKEGVRRVVNNFPVGTPSYMVGNAVVLSSDATSAALPPAE
jgi:iron complex transport system substrate-binding protein